MSSDVNAAINLRLSLLGLPLSDDAEGTPASLLVEPILARQRELHRRLHERLCAADLRIQNFLDDYLADAAVQPELPHSTLVLDQPGLARGLSLPINRDSFTSELLSSYRVLNGVLHNPASDRRTTAGVFHIAEGGLPIPDDKIAVNKDVYARILDAALKPPHESMILPFTSHEHNPAAAFATLLLRPVVVPEVPGHTRQRSSEIRFIVPGGLVSNLDFVEKIFGNAGDPYLPENDASLDPATWTGHTGCVILAPHVTALTKKELGLPHVSEATPRQVRDRQCWEDPAELYNDGLAFKVCARDERGVMVTVIADNYFGYCKKEVKTQISYSANLLGGAEEEHSGGAQVYPSNNLGQEFTDDHTPADYTLQAIIERDPERFTFAPEGYLIDNDHPTQVIVPAGSTFSLRTQTVCWDTDAGRQTIKLYATHTYFLPNGFRVTAAQSESDRTQWGLTGTTPVTTQIHKPATVSGGGKSEISKSIADAFVFGNAYVADFEADMDAVQALLDRDYTNRFADEAENGKDHRPILSDERSLGSVIKLLTPRTYYSDEYREFLANIPPHIKELVFIVKRFYRPDWGNDWRSHFSVGIINGRLGNALRLDGIKIAVNMLRVGFDKDGSWRLFSLRNDFSPALKVQTQDDITATTVLPCPDGRSRKFVINAERMLFQRPDDAVIRGYDKQAESDIAGPDTFLSNFEPLDGDDARELIEDAIGFSQFTEPMQEVIKRAAAGIEGDPPYFVSSAQARLVDGKASKNPRYLQARQDLSNPIDTAASDLANHLYRKLRTTKFAPLPVDIVAAGRRNNPPEPGSPALCAYNPLHYMELPELFMEFISSMTGKSPSTTGAGSEGALTKGPFNAMPATIDLNNNFLAYVLGGYDGWLSSAGYLGPHNRVAHDISLLIPELFARMRPEEREASALIEGKFLHRIEDFTHDGRTVEASRLGYRINKRFASEYFGRIFLHPDVVFTDEMLAPELQDPAVYADSIDVIVETHRRTAQAYFDDGTIELACPPIKGLLEIMAHGQTAEGWGLHTPEFRELFTRESVMASDWYAARLDAKQAREIAHCEAAIEVLTDYTSETDNLRVADRLGLHDRLESVRAELARVSSDEYRQGLVGTIGRQVRFG